MSHMTGISRVILVVIDGLRADAIHLFPLPNFAFLADCGAHTFNARTVTPSVTAAAMTSLLTGVAPHVHGLTSDRFGMPRARVPLTPVTQHLRRAGMPSSTFLAELPRAYRGLAARIARGLAVDHASFRGQTASDIVRVADASLSTQRRGLILLHWPDADRAGHAHGWSSSAYAHVARQLDETLGALARRTDALRDQSTLMIVCADHGGGGVDARSHDSLHPLDQRIPLLLLGGAVRRGRLGPNCSLLDVPATICWALGLQPPATYGGRPLRQAFLLPDEPLATIAAVA
ncbi:MAG TPA: alkaline phosphatase family protein [Gemmatimonadaceae bacterium]